MTDPLHPDDLIRYDRLIEGALRGVMIDALRRAARDGLPGKHHFYITFRTKSAGVEIPDYLRARYPQEMTIVLQHQFFGLRVDDESFTVMLSFSGKQERLHLPFSAVTTFADPSVNFALQFQMVDAPDDSASDDDSTPTPTAFETLGDTAQPNRKDSGQKDSGTTPSKVISLDQFRKK